MKEKQLDYYLQNNKTPVLQKQVFILVQILLNNNFYYFR